MTFFQSLILGIVQGLTEYLPVSSSAHLVLVPYLLNWSFPAAQIFPFDVLVQMGTLVAVILYFWKDLISILKCFFKGLIDKEPFKDPQARLGWYLLLATIPATFAGLLLKNKVEAVFSDPRVTAYFLFTTAALLVISDLVGKRTRKLDEMTWWDALWIGLFQAIAIFPGISRSGSTISGGMTRNFDRTNSARFSFLMSIPVMIGAGLVSIKDLAAVPNLGAFLPVLAVGFITEVIVGYLAIHWLLSFIKRHNFWPFAVYCVVFAGIILTISSIRSTPASGVALSTNDVSTISAPTATSSENGLQIINLQYSNSLDWLTPTMTSCANLITNTALVTHNLDTNDLTLQNSDLILRWGSPAGLTQPAFQIGSERLVLAVNAANPLSTLPLDLARQVFSGNIMTWGDLYKTCPECFAANYASSYENKTIALNFYSASEDIQELFMDKVMGNQPVASAAALLLPDPIAMQEILASDAYAIGFLPSHLLDANLKEVNLKGLDSSLLQQPILAISQNIPQGKTSQWLLCIQKVLNP